MERRCREDYGGYAETLEATLLTSACIVGKPGATAAAVRCPNLKV